MTPVETLPSDLILQRCAEAWGLSNLVFVRKMENIVYACNSDFGKVYLRLTSPLRRKKAEIQTEIDWMEHLAESGLNVPRPMTDKNGRKILSLIDGAQRFEAVVFSAV